jgi:hypothetical protein
MLLAKPLALGIGGHCWPETGAVAGAGELQEVYQYFLARRGFVCELRLGFLASFLAEEQPEDHRAP